MFEIDGQLFEWDKSKNLSNISKHGIPFKLAATVFSATIRIISAREANSIESKTYGH